MSFFGAHLIQGLACGSTRIYEEQSWRLRRPPQDHCLVLIIPLRASIAGGGSRPRSETSCTHIFICIYQVPRYRYIAARLLPRVADSEVVIFIRPSFPVKPHVTALGAVPTCVRTNQSTWIFFFFFLFKKKKKGFRTYRTGTLYKLSRAPPPPPGRTR